MKNEFIPNYSKLLMLWQELHTYLKTEIEIVPSKANTGKNLGDINLHKDEIIKAKIIVSNTAPDCIDGPHVVFIGVNLGIANARHPNNMIRRGSKISKPSQDIELDRENYWYEIDKYNRFQPKFPGTTWEEEQMGNILFPGESYVWELEVPFSDVLQIKFCVDGTVSRRHLFHYNKRLSIPIS
jgi:hypothetical protein